MTSTDSRGSLGPKLPPHHPPPALEERVVATLARRGLLAARPSGRARLPRTWKVAAALAAGIALFAAGALSERARSTGVPIPDARPRYALLLYGGTTADPATEQALVDEYRRWARGIAQRGHYVTGEKLGDEARELTGPGAAGATAPRSPALAGFFIVSAATPAEAESIARSCPHLRHGGRIVVRPIEPT